MGSTWKIISLTTGPIASKPVPIDSAKKVTSLGPIQWRGLPNGRKKRLWKSQKSRLKTAFFVAFKNWFFAKFNRGIVLKPNVIHSPAIGASNGVTNDAGKCFGEEKNVIVFWSDH